MCSSYDYVHDPRLYDEHVCCLHLDIYYIVDHLNVPSHALVLGE
jgi:hypothetical protein